MEMIKFFQQTLIIRLFSSHFDIVLIRELLLSLSFRSSFFPLKQSHSFVKILILKTHLHLLYDKNIFRYENF